MIGSRATLAAIAMAALIFIAMLPAQTPGARVYFADATPGSGLDFQHVTGASGEKNYIETMGSGACWFDYDRDGDIDIYVVNSAELPGFKVDVKPINHMFRNDGKGRFTDVTGESGLGDGGYGMGCVAGDIEGDGDLDVYVTNFGPNVLYRNDGKGRFTDITAEAGVGDTLWSGSAAFGDIDNDGDLDLYVTNYLDFSLENNKYCGERKPGYRAYCHPEEFNGVPDRLFRNKGDGRFEDVTEAAGVGGRIGNGLGVVFTDVNDDGWPDIYVANDKTINFTFLNKGDGTFKDISMTSGAGFSESGMTQAGMGVDTGDINGDGRLDLVVTNLDYETNELYTNNGDLTFTDATFRAGLGQPNFLHVGFGIDLLDYDDDGDNDILIMNGHILDNIELFRDQVTYQQPRSLLLNDGTGRFTDISDKAGDDFSKVNVGRGLAVGDYDDDGDLDFFVVNSGRKAQLFRNEGGNDPARGGGHWLMVRLHGVKSNRDGVGARVRVKTTGPKGEERWQVDLVKTASSYMSQNDMRLHFGLGASASADVVEIRWPSGAVQTLTDVKGDRLLDVTEEGKPR